LSPKGWIRTTIALEELPSGTYYLMSRDVRVEYATKFLILD